MICDAVLVPDASSEASMVSDSIEKFIYEQYISDFAGQVDQLEDRYLGMVEAASSNLAMCSRWNAKTITKGIVSFADVLHDIV